jgi:hypothetical protein
MRAQKQPHSISQKEKDGYMKDNTRTRVLVEAKAKSIEKPQGYRLMVIRSKECIRPTLETHKQSQVI